ncbi:transposase [Thiothrix lacustris]|uniref:transposase n=1 Tax=Thiothrix lacustris TaxID=525917 RepID=UPI0027E474DC|nr:transposase [Thiothrix lacustris]WMP17082.1 transposase [Thiothrix lacustris]
MRNNFMSSSCFSSMYLDSAEFRQAVHAICKLYHQAESLYEQGIHLVSTDEKTGMQAIERIHPDHPMEPGQPERHEFEYTRHGTQCLIANFEIATGQVIASTIGDTRTETDFVSHIKTTVDTAAEDQWVFVVDQLNTHKSAGLVEYVAQACQLDQPLGEKGKSGILNNMASRMGFLQDETHRIRFVFTPKHCSWLNQVEIWFGIISRRLLKRGSFTSQANLKQRVEVFIDYFNQYLAKSFRWTYIGKPLVA